MQGRAIAGLTALILAAVLVVLAAAPTLAAPRTLRQGDRGEDVRTLQSHLTQAGYSTGGVTGYFGSGTLKAVRALQGDLSLKVDGVVGPATLAALDKALSRAASGGGTAPVTAPQSTTYVVKSGDSLSVIAARYKVGLQALLNANGLKNADRILVGQRLTIPTKGSSGAGANSGTGTPPASLPPPPQPDVTEGDQATPVLYQASRRLALTFDDGPDGTQTPLILQVLAKHKALATFFVVGEKAAANGNLVKEIAASGHAVENHGYQHQDLTRLSAAAAGQNVERGAAVIKEFTGRSPEFFRPPGGAFNEAVTAAAQGAGERLVLWSNIGKTSLPAAELKERLLSAAFDGAILLLHDTDPAVTEILDSVLTELEKDGYSFVTVPQLFSQ